jgi:DNA polymerase-3 subunit delta'
VLNLAHPDCHWLVPVEAPQKASDPEKQVDLVEEALGEELAARRARPLYGPPSGLASHGIASVRLLLRRLRLTAVMGGHRVFIIGDAERLVPQPGAEAAANALLKALEEPPAGTVFVLTASDAAALLPTIKSRVVRVRVAPLPDSVVTSFVQNEVKPPPPPEAVPQIAAAAEGCIGRVLAQEGPAGRVSAEDPEKFLRAVRGPAAARYAAALRQPPFQARGGFTALLDGLLERLRQQARSGGSRVETAKVASAIAQVLAIRDWAQGNVNPQLLTAVLAADLTESP